MLLYKTYDENALTERAWFQSSMIVYTKMVEHPDDNFGELYITYKGGATYHYKNVSLQDYVVFIGGGTDGSHGKTINKIIKGNYEFEKVDSLNVEDLEKECDELLKKQQEENEEFLNDYNKRWVALKNDLEALVGEMNEKYTSSENGITKEMFDELIDYLYNYFKNIIE